ncbi:hypothetical protein DFP93_13139 [Aneurinibacillus soli]|uniref:Uncharacterized protein n=1 Tax=Aneurinibacillus soli TaxID=1500254 RepID=A0A0U5B399_9BACL|nr:hypothetical protein [Aneurinibacillus soli]PYE57401.1 hypothetical protein DFP93_13139 [Aneurinibacillus soli]BAU28800.1 hypothetical protein CB4_02977 [Aneurinibacillus soli]
MKRVFLIISLSVFLITTGCTPINKISEKEMKSETEISPIKIVENSPVTTHIDNKCDFTYLEGLPEDKLKKYNLFLKDGNTDHLTDFTPEQIVLLYMNLVLELEHSPHLKVGNSWLVHSTEQNCTIVPQATPVCPTVG